MSIDKILREELAHAEERILARIKQMFTGGADTTPGKSKAKAKPERRMRTSAADNAMNIAQLVRDKPGLKMTEIVEELDLTTAVFGRAIKIAKEKRLVEMRGERRASRYFPKGYKVTSPVEPKERPTRRTGEEIEGAIIKQLRKGPLNLTGVVKATNLPQTTIINRLKKMTDEHTVDMAIVGTVKTYSLSGQALQ